MFYTYNDYKTTNIYMFIYHVDSIIFLFIDYAKYFII